MKIILNIIFVTLLVVANALAAPSIMEGNDWFSSFIKPSDRNLTNEIELSTTKPYGSMPCVLQNLASLLPEIACGTSCTVTPQFVGFGAGQQIFTPDDKEPTYIVEDDNPYAGWLYARLTRLNQTETERISTSLYAGIIGPWAFGDEVQSGFHKLLGQSVFNGWDNQLKNEPAFYLNYKRAFIDYKTSYFMALTDSELNLGTVHTDIALRRELRFGYNLQGYNLDNKKFSTYLFLHPEVRGVLRNIFYDGNTFRDSHRVAKENFQALVDSGLVLEYYGFQITYHVSVRTKDYHEQDDNIYFYAGLKLEKLFEE